MSDTKTLRDYEAIDPQDRTAKRAIVLRLASGETVHLKYPDIHLKRVSPDQAAMAIFCYSINVVIWGRQLGVIANAMDGEHIGWVQEFDAARWDLPDDPGAPLVERIETYAKKGDDGDGPEGAKPIRGSSLSRLPAHEPETVERQKLHG